MAQVRYKHALRRLKMAFPGELCDWTANSAERMVRFCGRAAQNGHPIPAAAAAARRIVRDRQWAARTAKVTVDAEDSDEDL